MWLRANRVFELSWELLLTFADFGQADLDLTDDRAQRILHCELRTVRCALLIALDSLIP